MKRHYIKSIRTLANEKGWSKQKAKSIRGQILKMTDRDAKEYIEKLKTSL